MKKKIFNQILGMYYVQPEQGDMEAQERKK